MSARLELELSPLKYSLPAPRAPTTSYLQLGELIEQKLKFILLLLRELVTVGHTVASYKEARFKSSPSKKGRVDPMADVADDLNKKVVTFLSAN